MAAAGAVLLLALGGAWLALGSDDAKALKPTGSAQPQTMEEFLTAVTQDVDAYWTQVFKDSGLPEPRVSYAWIPAGQTAASACGDDGTGTLGDSAAAYCPADDTIYISQAFATGIYTGALDRALPGSSQGYGRTVGDFSVAYIVAHEYGHQIQDELGLFEKYGAAADDGLRAAGRLLRRQLGQQRLPGGPPRGRRHPGGARRRAGRRRLRRGHAGHHGTPEQREAAWRAGFDSDSPSSCGTYLDPGSYA